MRFSPVGSSRHAIAALLTIALVACTHKAADQQATEDGNSPADDEAPATGSVPSSGAPRAAPPASPAATTSVPPSPATLPLSTQVSLSRVTPPTAVIGSVPATGLGITLIGSGFPPGALVAIGADVLPATVVDPTTITLVLPASRLVTPGLLPLAIVSGNPQTRSNEIDLTVVSSSAAPASLEPSSTTARSFSSTSSLPLVVHGDSFDPTSVVTFDGVEVATTFSSPTTVVATVPPNLLHTSRQVLVSVRRMVGPSTPLVFAIVPGSGGGTSCGNRGRCSDTGMKPGECTGDFPAYRCGTDGCLTLVGGCF